VKFKESNLAGILVTVIALAVLGQGCGIFSPDEGDGKEDPLPEMPPTSPKAVIENMVHAYNKFDFERYRPLIHEDFIFYFNEDDIGVVDEVPDEGYWGAPEELESAEHMLDENFEPSDPTYKIDSMKLLIQKSGDPWLLPSNFENAPEGALEGYVTFDLMMETSGGSRTVEVSSRPLFVFTRDDSTTEQVTWKLLMIKDAPYEK
jgi:hypothetical protein